MVNPLGLHAPDGSTYITITDGAGGIVTQATLPVDAGAVQTLTTPQQAQARSNIGVTGGTAKINIFTSSGTYTPTSGMKYCIIECIGGGAGGGGAASSLGQTGSGGGGGGGSYSRLYATAATIGASQVITIGAAGLAGLSGANPGGNGGDTSVGTLCIGKGGTQGSGQVSGGAAGGGVGGVAGTGDVTVVGNAGGQGIGGTITSLTSISGFGANGPFGGGVAGVGAGTVNGSAGTSYGAGGSGGAAFNSGSAAGGAGFKGVVIITEYIGT